jgi:hypothetical protein
MSSPSGPPLQPLPYAQGAQVAPPQISPEHLLQLQNAKRGMRKIRRAISTATFDGWTLAAFGVVTFIFGMGDVVAVALGAGLMAIGVIELYAARRLKRLEPPAVGVLVWNQIALGSVLMIYAIWRVFDVLHNPANSAFAAEAAAAGLNAGDLKGLAGLDQSITLLVYYSLMAVAVFGQGGLALFYFTRRKHLQAYLAETPTWITQMQKAGMGI